jgi:hypothetical protein
VEESKHTFILNPKIVPFMRKCGKYDAGREAADGNITRLRKDSICFADN